MKMNFLQIKIGLEKKLACLLQVLNQSCNRCVGIEAEDNISERTQQSF